LPEHAVIRSVVELLTPAALLLVLTGCGSGADAAAGGPPPGPPPVAVETAVDTVEDAILATGQIEALQQIELRPEVEGRVIELLFQEGQRVAAGTPLVKIDDAELVAQVERARADRDLAEQALARTRELLASGATSPAELDRAEATARSAAASLTLLEVRLERTTVRAPFGGMVGQRLVSLGDYVNSQSSLLTLQTVSPARVVFSVPERYAGELKAGQPVTFRVAALTGREYTAQVDFVDPVVTLPSRTITVKAIAGNAGGQLQPGMFLEARLATARRSNATVVPEEAISPTASSVYLWVIVGGRATRREVELGVRAPGFVEVRSGVLPGEQVVVGGVDKLVEGAAVTVTEVTRVPRGGREG
jgi:membrane fusion protein (multidrug efflux system)